MKIMIFTSSTIEEIISLSPEFIDYLSKKGIRCIRCGEPIWGTIEEAASQKGYKQDQIHDLVVEMNKMLAKIKEAH